MSLTHRLSALIALGAIALVATACAGSPSIRPEKVTDTSGGGASTMADTGMTTSDAASTTTAAADANTVTVDLAKSSPFSLEPSVTSVPAGKITFDAINEGTMVHELVVLQTDKTIKQLTQPDGRADETNNIGETGDVAAGASKSFTLDLKPGHYWLVCNIPGHLAGGMYSEFTVTA
ncbi:MAG: sulfocyanin-like copper-binding protein [Gaiellales bacterium]